MRKTLLLLRFALFGLLGIILIFVLNSAAGAVLMRIAKRLSLNEVNRQLVVWLRAPISLLLSELIMELASVPIMRLQMPTKKLSDGQAAQDVQALCRTQSLPIPALYAIELSELGYYQMRGLGRTLFLSPEIRDRLPPSEFRFLALRQLSGWFLKHKRNRMIYATAVSATLLLPYLLAVQLTPHHVPVRWILPVWIGLFVLLFLVQSALLARFERAQAAQSVSFALSRLRMEPTVASQASVSLAKLNAHTARLCLLLANPARALELSGRYPPRLLRHDLAKLAAASALGLAGAFLFLKPKFDLRRAAFEGNEAGVRRRLDAGISPNSVDIISNGQTPLIAAAQKDHQAIIQLLLERGANPNQLNPLGLSPLLLASEQGTLETARMLVDHGANVNFKGFKGYTPLMVAASHGHRSVAALLLSHGARIDERSKHGSTALLLAVQTGQTAMVDYLIKNHADVRAKDVDGDTALALAKKKGFTPLVRLLENAEKK